MDLPPPNTVTRATNLGPAPKIHPLVCTVVCDVTTVELTYQREGFPVHRVETFD